MAKEKKNSSKSNDDIKAAEEKENTAAASQNEEDNASSSEKESPDTGKEKLVSENAELKKQIDNLNDKLLRTVAEYDNFRKRSQKEKEAIYSDSKADILLKILPVVDNFERAAVSDADLDNYKKGIEMIVKQLLDALKSMGAEAFAEPGDAFDPNLHNGVMHVEDENLGENVIAEVFIKGYKAGDRVIRPATVKVAN